MYNNGHVTLLFWNLLKTENEEDSPQVQIHKNITAEPEFCSWTGKIRKHNQKTYLNKDYVGSSYTINWDGKGGL